MADKNDVEAEMTVRPMPQPRHKASERTAPGIQYRKSVMARRALRVGGFGVLLGLAWWKIPGEPEKRQLIKDSINEYIEEKHDMRGIVDLEIYEELETIGKLQRRKRWMGQPIPVINDAARELGFDVHRYPWNYDRKPPPNPWYSPTTVWYKFNRQFYYTPEEIAEIDRLYSDI